jgi:hypothetical protein
VGAVVVKQDGPLRIEQLISRARGVRYLLLCDDCGSVTWWRNRADADGSFEAHDHSDVEDLTK